MQPPINDELRQIVCRRIQRDKSLRAWSYIQHNQAALAEIEKIIAERAIGSVDVPNRKCGTIVYSELFASLMVDVSISGLGASHKLSSTAGWRDAEKNKTEDGEIVEQFLRVISMCSYCQWGFMASVCVVHSGEHGPVGVPGWEFFSLAKDWGVMVSGTSDAQFANDEKQAALHHYAEKLLNPPFVPATAMLYPWRCP